MALRVGALLALAIGTGAVPGSAGGQARFESLGDFTPAGVSADGRFVVGSLGSAGAAMLDGSARIELGFLPGGLTSAAARAVVRDGSIVVGTSRSSLGSEAFRWEGGVMEGLGDLRGGTHISSWPADVSADGSVIVGLGSVPEPNFRRAFVWTRELGMRQLPGLPDTRSSRAWAVSDDGRIAVGVNDHGIEGQGLFSDAVRWVDGEIEVLDPRLLWSDARAVTPDGSVIVGVASLGRFQGSQAFRWEAGETRHLGDLPGGETRSEAHGVAANGWVVAGVDHAGGVDEDGYAAQRVFVWDPLNGIQDLRELLEREFGIETPGWKLFSVHISDDGRTLVGGGARTDIGAEGWKVVLPPACGDSLDNDGDLRADFEGDPACSGPEDPTEDVFEVQVDIAPGSPQNAIPPQSRGRIQVALLGSQGLDVSEVEIDSLRFGPSGAPALGAPPPRVRRGDLVVAFSIPESGIAFGDTEACMSGRMRSGEPLHGCDVVSTLSGCGSGFAAALAPPAVLAARRRSGRRRGRVARRAR